MNKRILFNLLYTSVFGALLVSCNTSENFDTKSRATGVDYNKDGGFRVPTNFQEQETPVGTVPVEGGTFTMGRVQDDVMHDWNNTPNQQHVQSFYLDETEVTNLMYLEYLEWTKRIFPPTNPDYRNIYYGAVPDTLVWRNRLGFNEVMTNNYLRHPAYRNYPVVGVSWIQAVEFSNWRSERVNEQLLTKNGFLSEDAAITAEEGTQFNTATLENAPSELYGGDEGKWGGKQSEKRLEEIEADSTGRLNRYPQRNSGQIPPKYRLPTEVEWEYAALGLKEIRNYNIYRGRKKYPWKGQYTRSGKKNKFGDQLANFKQADGDYGGIAGWSDDGADITAEIKSYPPNDYGLYDMAGNVAEWVADVYRPIVDDDFNDFNYYRGNVYMKNAIASDGSVTVLGTNEVVYDTLSNGKIIARTLPGEIRQVPIDENETYLRPNFSESDNRNYRDGDKQSSRYYEAFEEIQGNPTKAMYNSPNHSVTANEDGTLKREYDKSTKRKTLVDDAVRVYKGGSWKDRAYWLDPAQRRYFPQDMATDYIGFRNAVSRVGGKFTKVKRPTD